MRNRYLKRILMTTAAAALTVCLVPEASVTGVVQTETEGVSETEENENYTTGDASLDDPLNSDSIGEKEILVLSFGTSYNYSRYAAIGGVERAIAAAFPDWGVRRGFTSDTIISHVLKRDGEKIDSLDEALERAVKNGVKQLIVCPTHLMAGHEYEDVINAVSEYKDKFESVAVTDPLFGQNDKTDYGTITPVITNLLANYDDGETALVYMGHGTDAESDKDYGQLQEYLTDSGYDNYYITTVESAVWNTDRVLDEIKDKGYKKVVLRPLMMVAGDHAHNDMSGFDKDSLRSQFQEAGYETDCILDGLGEVPGIQQIFVDHVQDKIEATASGDTGFDDLAKMVSSGDSSETEEMAAEDDNFTVTPEMLEDARNTDTSQVAQSSDMASTEKAQDADKQPITADMLTDGSYDVKVQSSSSMFRIDSAVLVVKDGSMYVNLTLDKKGYQFLYPGTTQKAAEADAENFIYYQTDAEGKYVYMHFPVEALNKPVDCAAFSIRKHQWYPRTLTFSL